MEEQVSTAIFLGLDMAELIAIAASPLLFAIAVWLGMTAGDGQADR